MNEYGVHTAHCCVKHGCKYEDENCPVINRKVRQQYTCEWCNDDGIKTIEELYDSMIEHNSKTILKIAKLLCSERSIKQPCTNCPAHDLCDDISFVNY